MNSGTIAHGKAHSGDPKEKTAPEGIETEDSGDVAERHHPMLLLGPAHPSHSAGRHRQQSVGHTRLPYQVDIDSQEQPDGNAEL